MTVPSTVQSAPNFFPRNAAQNALTVVVLCSQIRPHGPFFPQTPRAMLCWKAHEGKKNSPCVCMLPLQLIVTSLCADVRAHLSFSNFSLLVVVLFLFLKQLQIFFGCQELVWFGLLWLFCVKLRFRKVFGVSSKSDNKIQGFLRFLLRESEGPEGSQALVWIFVQTHGAQIQWVSQVQAGNGNFSLFGSFLVHLQTSTCSTCQAVVTYNVRKSCFFCHCKTSPASSRLFLFFLWKFPIKTPSKMTVLGALCMSWQAWVCEFVSREWFWDLEI